MRKGYRIVSGVVPKGTEQAETGPGDLERGGRVDLDGRDDPAAKEGSARKGQ